MYGSRRNGELVYLLRQDIYDRVFTDRKVTPYRVRPRSKVKQLTVPYARRILGAPLYLVHTSCIDALEAITRARLEGQRVFARS